MNERWDEVSELLEAALALPAPDRAEFLRKRCGADDSLRREVEALLEEDDAAGRFLTPPITCAVPAADALRTETALGSKIGGFLLVRHIGAGGMGSVFEAEQVSPRRRVALKILSGLIVHDSARHRFAREATLLARMNHPAIAQVFASGIDGSTPYIAMELVPEARTITAYARQSSLTPRECVALMRRVAEGLAHAHARGVVHRDLKPSNVLVDQHGAPKLIDFGIARALDDDGGTLAHATHEGDLLGTLQYMSPEQAEGSGGEIDVQSDVYSLGLILYELLAGRRAHEIEGQTLTSALRTIAAGQVKPLSRLRPELPIELDWITRKALERERDRRYASIPEFDADLGRFLEHVPVLAGPPSRAYQLKKFLRRNRLVVAALVSVFAALAIGLALALQQRERAREALTTTERTLSELTTRTHELELETSRKSRLLAFQKRLLTAASPDSDGHDVRVIDVLDRARVELGHITAESEVVMELRAALGEAYKNLGRPKEARVEYGIALSLARSLPATSITKLAKLERDELAARLAIAPDAEVVSAARALVLDNERRLGSDAFESNAALLLLIDGLSQSGASTEAEELLRAALPRFEPQGEDGWATTANRLLINLLMGRGARAEAEQIARAELGRLESTDSSEDGRVLELKEILVDLLASRGVSAEVEPLARNLVEVHTRRSGPDHVDTLRARLRLAATQFDLGRNVEAMSELDDVLERTRRHSDRASARIRHIDIEIGIWFARRHRAPDAVVVLRDVDQRFRAAGLSETLDAFRAVEKLVYSLGRMKEFDEAVALGRDAVARAEASLGPDHAQVRMISNTLAVVLQLAGRHAEAADILAREVLVNTRVLGATHLNTLSSKELLAGSWLAIGRAAEAESELRAALDARGNRTDSRLEDTLHTRLSLARLLDGQDRIEEAEYHLCQVVEGAADLVPDPRIALSYFDWLAALRIALGRRLDALSTLLEANDFAVRTLPDNVPARVQTALSLAGVWESTKRPERAVELLEPIRALILAGKVPKGTHSKTCHKLLLKCYTQLGRTEDAETMRVLVETNSKNQ